jgi:hypothetical protein
LPITTPCSPSALVEHGRHAEGDHEPREVGATHDEHAAQRAQHRGAGDGHRQAHQRVGHHVLGEKRRGVGPEAEEGRVAERHDAGVAEDQVEREREEREDRDLVEQQRVAAREEHRGNGHHRECDLPPAPARGGAQRNLHFLQ